MSSPVPSHGHIPTPPIVSHLLPPRTRHSIFPEDIILEGILPHLPKRDLANLALTNSFHYTLLLPYLYKVVSLGSQSNLTTDKQPSFEGTLNFLSRNPCVAAHVRILDLTQHPGCVKHKPSALPHLPKLKAIAITLTEDSADWEVILGCFKYSVVPRCMFPQSNDYVIFGVNGPPYALNPTPTRTYDTTTKSSRISFYIHHTCRLLDNQRPPKVVIRTIGLAATVVFAARELILPTPLLESVKRFVVVTDLTSALVFKDLHFRIVYNAGDGPIELVQIFKAECHSNRLPPDHHRIDILAAWIAMQPLNLHFTLVNAPGDLADFLQRVTNVMRTLGFTTEMLKQRLEAIRMLTLLEYYRETDTEGELDEALMQRLRSLEGYEKYGYLT